MSILKMGAVLFAALSVGLGLFVLMQIMISPDSTLQRDNSDTESLNFVRVKLNEQQARIKERQLPKESPPPEPPPSTPELEVAQSNQTASPQPLAMNLPNLNMPLSGGDGPFIGAPGAAGGGMSAFDTDVIPLVQVRPAYPRSAKQARIEGYVTMSVTIRPDGTVSNVKVIKAEPRRLFDKSAKAAMMRWKFRPKIVDGQPVSQQAEQTIEFKLGAL